MQKRCEAYFSIEQVLLLELLEQVENDEAQLLRGLHECYAARCSLQEIDQVGTLRGRNEIVSIGFLRNRRIDSVHDVVAQRTVKVKVEFHFGVRLEIHTCYLLIALCLR